MTLTQLPHLVEDVRNILLQILDATTRPSAPATSNPLLTVAEAAEVLRLSPRQVSDLCSAGLIGCEVKGVRSDGRPVEYLIPADDLAAFRASRYQPAAPLRRVS